MARSNRIALIAALALLVALAGSTLANRAPETAEEPAQLASSHEVEDETDGATVARDRLADAGIEADPAIFDELAASHGVGGALRLFAWADATGMSVGEIADLRAGDEPLGWGVLARELGVHPGIGAIMGRGHGPDGPPGLEKKPDAGADD